MTQTKGGVTPCGVTHRVLEDTVCRGIASCVPDKVDADTKEYAHGKFNRVDEAQNGKPRDTLDK